MSIIQWASKVKDIKNLINYNPSKEIQQVLEPLSCMIRLAMLYYKPEKTKISISNNRIYFQNPNVFQGTLRWKNGDTRLDIHNLHKTINKALIWYDVQDENINYIFKIAKKGLSKLNKCYNETSNITSHSLVYYIKIIDNAIENKDIKKTKVDDIYYDPFSKIWNDNQIQCVNLLLFELSKTEDNREKDIVILTIETLLSHKDQCVINIVEKFSTSL